MRKITILLLITLSLAGCAKELDETVYSSLTDDTAFTSDGNALAAVNAIYAPLHSLYREPMFFLNDVTVDTGYKGGSPFEVLNEQGIYNDNRTLNAWNYLYQIATRANVAIDKISAMEARYFSKISRDQLLGEAYFMRAFAYYNLTDLFCRVPLVLDSEIPPTSKEPIASIDKLESRIEEDLLEAKSRLPKRYASTADAGRPTYGAACGYLCRLYMRQAGRERVAGGKGAWRDALVEANNVLALEGSVYSLQPTVWNVFDPSTQEGLYNDELIFAIRASDKTLVNGSWDLGLQFTPWAYDMGWSNILQQIEMTWWFEDGDERLSRLQVMEFPDVYNGTKIEKVYYKAPEDIKKTGTHSGKETIGGVEYLMTELDATFTQKYKYLYTREYNYNTPNNLPLLRLADIILCKAEILNEIDGPTEEAVALINRIRERAFGNKKHNFSLSEFASKDELRDAICDERMYELNMECLRRPDLIRMGLWKNRMQRLMLSVEEKYYWKEKNEDRAVGYYDGSWASYPKPSSLTDDDPRQYIPIPYREVLMNSSLSDAREIEAVATPDVTKYEDPHHWGAHGEGSDDPGPDDPLNPDPKDPDPPAAGSTVWNFDDAGGWVYAPQEGTPQSQTKFEGGYLYITSRAGTKDRPKYSTPSANYGAGSYRFRVLIPEIEAGAQASIGAFIYNDDSHELDFEIGYGPSDRRADAGAKSDEMIACMTNQNHPFISGNAPLKTGWHTLRLDMETSGEYYNAIWYIDGAQVQSRRLNFGPEIKFRILVSVENLSFMGDHLPTRDVTAQFDYVSFKAF